MFDGASRHTRHAASSCNGCGRTGAENDLSSTLKCFEAPADARRRRWLEEAARETESLQDAPAPTHTRRPAPRRRGSLSGPGRGRGPRSLRARRPSRSTAARHCFVQGRRLAVGRTVARQGEWRWPADPAARHPIEATTWRPASFRASARRTRVASCAYSRDPKKPCVSRRRKGGPAAASARRSFATPSATTSSPSAAPIEITEATIAVSCRSRQGLPEGTVDLEHVDRKILEVLKRRVAPCRSRPG